MAKLVVTDRDGVEAEVAAKSGVSVMEILREVYPDDILALCGGSCSCATCHVYVDAAFLEKLPAQSSFENELLDMTSIRQSNSRLTCQIPFTDALDGMKLTIPPEE